MLAPRVGLLAVGLLFHLQLASQFKPSDFITPPQYLHEINDGYQNINPVVSQDGSQLWFTKISHPANAGGKGSQDVWHCARERGQWGAPVNELPGLNSELNDLVVGRSGNDLIYAMQFRNGEDSDLNIIKAFRKKDGVYVPDHELRIPKMQFLSEFFGFFVASDESCVIVSMKGEYSFGKEDLYVLLKKNGTWTEPIHMGARVNTIGFEMSPYLSNDGKHLFFASEGHNSFGSADVFVCHRVDDTWQNWSKPINLGPNINTASFEAYFCLNETENEGYFISNRGGEAGSMYSISYKPAPQNPEITAHAAASGFIRMEKLPAMNITLNLLDENDRLIQSITTNEEGYFNLQSFLPDRDYKLAIDESVRQQLEGADIFLTNDLGEKMVFMNQNELGIFGFKVLSGQKVSEVEQLESLAGKGKIVDKPTMISGKVATYGTLADKVTLKVVDENNRVLETVQTDENGYFSFSTRASERSYFLSVDADLNGLVDVYEIFLTNDNPNEDIMVTKTDKHLFEFRALADGSNAGLKRLTERDAEIPQNVLTKYGLVAAGGEDDITGYLRLDKLPLINTEIVLMDEHDNLLGKAVTNSEGMFTFPEIQEGEYVLKLRSDQEEELAKSEIYLARNPDDMLIYLSDNRAGVFAFKKLARDTPMTLYSLRTDTEDGKVVRETQASIKGKFEYKRLPKSGVHLKLMDEKENVIQVTEVDKNGEFTFENYFVNKNYFISVEGGEGLSDIYEIYLSGQHKNVLVNSTNQYVYAFKVLPSQDIVLTQAYEQDSRMASAQSSGTSTDKRSYYEYDLNLLEASNYVILQRVAGEVTQGYHVTIRLSREISGSEGVQLQTLEVTEARPVVEALQRFGVPGSKIMVRPNGSDQLLLHIRP